MEVVSHYYRLTFLNRRVRRSTLLPQARRGGGGDGEGGGGEPALAMSRAPSPIMPHHLTLPINHTFPGMGGNRTRQESLEYSFGSNKDDGDHLSYPLPEVEEVAREVSELAEEVQQLRHANRRLAGEKNHLTFHLTTAEDDLSSLRDKCRHLEKILHIKQRELQELKGLESDVELLRGQLEEEREGRARLVAQVASGEKSIMSLTDKLEEIEEQLRGAQEEMAKEHEVIRALKMINGVMEEEKQSLQEQLMLVNQEFEAFRTFSSVRSYQSAHSSRSDLSSFGFGEVNGTVDDERKTTSDDDSTTANDNQAPQHPLPPAPPPPQPPLPPPPPPPMISFPSQPLHHNP